MDNNLGFVPHPYPLWTKDPNETDACWRLILGWTPMLPGGGSAGPLAIVEGGKGVGIVDLVKTRSITLDAAQVRRDNDAMQARIDEAAAAAEAAKPKILIRDDATDFTLYDIGQGSTEEDKDS